MHILWLDNIHHFTRNHFSLARWLYAHFVIGQHSPIHQESLQFSKMALCTFYDSTLEMAATTLNLSIKSDMTGYQELLPQKDYNIMVGLRWVNKGLSFPWTSFYWQRLPVVLEWWNEYVISCKDVITHPCPNLSEIKALWEDKSHIKQWMWLLIHVLTSVDLSVKEAQAAHFTNMV